MKVRFSDDYDYKPTRACTIAYKSGMVETVKRACGEAAIAQGKAVEIAAAAEQGKRKPDGSNTISG